MPVETVLIQLLKLFWTVSVHFSYIQKFHKLQIYLLKLPLYFSTFINIVFNNCLHIYAIEKYLCHLDNGTGIFRIYRLSTICVDNTV